MNDHSRRRDPPLAPHTECQQLELMGRLGEVAGGASFGGAGTAVKRSYSEL